MASKGEWHWTDWHLTVTVHIFYKFPPKTKKYSDFDYKTSMYWIRFNHLKINTRKKIVLSTINCYLNHPLLVWLLTTVKIQQVHCGSFEWWSVFNREISVFFYVFVIAFSLLLWKKFKKKRVKNCDMLYKCSKLFDVVSDNCDSSKPPSENWLTEVEANIPNPSHKNISMKDFYWKKRSIRKPRYF